MLILATYRDAEGNVLKTGYILEGVRELTVSRVLEIAPKGTIEIDIKVRPDLDPIRIKPLSELKPEIGPSNDNGTEARQQ